jgi:hypothetical protein
MGEGLFVPEGRFSRWMLSQALRARLQSCCPSGTKYIFGVEALIKLALMGFQPWERYLSGEEP